MGKLLTYSAVMVLVFANGGCIYLTGEKTYWTKEFRDVSFDGPGTQDAQEQEYQDVKYKEDDGKCIAVGILPGCAHILREGYPTAGGKNAVRDTILFSMGVPFANIILGVPTLDSLLFEPFSDYHSDKTSFSKFGLLGVHKWKEAGSGRHRIDSRAIERVIVGCSIYKPEERIPTWISEDGIVVYFEYPGFDVIEAGVKRNGRVDVVYGDGEKVRRFEKASKAEDKVTYSDRNVASDVHLGNRVEFRKMCRELLIRAEATKTKVSTAKAQKEVSAIISEIKDRMDSPAPGTDMFSALDKEWAVRISRNLSDTEAFATGPIHEKKPSDDASRTEFDL